MNLSLASEESVFLKNSYEAETLIDVLKYHARKRATQTAYIFLADGENESDSISYGQLDRAARAIAGFLQKSVSVGDRALMMYPSGVEFLKAFFGCLYAGVIAVPAFPPRPNQKLSRIVSIAQSAEPSIVLSTVKVRDVLEPNFLATPELSSIQMVETDLIPVSNAVLYKSVALTGENLAFLQYTSGSTGSPKGVMVSHKNLLANEETIRVGFGYNEETLFGSWLPIFHDMGLIGNILQPFYLGVQCIFMPPEAFLQSPVRWLQMVSKYKVTTTGAPNFAYDLCNVRINEEQKRLLDLSNLKLAYCGSEPVRYETLRKFYNSFKSAGLRYEALFPCYGLAEATLYVSGSIPNKNPVTEYISRESLTQKKPVIVDGSSNGKYMVSCGRASLDTEIKIVDPITFSECKDGEIGEIWICGSSIAKGYWNRENETNAVFNAFISGTDEGPFMRTGDLGYTRLNELYITGRAKDMLLIRGKNHFPEDIEESLQNCHEALSPNACAVISVEIENEERIVIIQEIARSYVRKLDVDSVKKVITSVIAENHGLEICEIVLLKPLSIPKTTSGKIQRKLCKNLYLENKFEKL